MGETGIAQGVDRNDDLLRQVGFRHGFGRNDGSRYGYDGFGGGFLHWHWCMYRRSGFGAPVRLVR